MAGEKKKGGKKNRKHGRNKNYNLRRASDLRELRNRRRRMLRALKLGKYMDRQLALAIHADTAIKFVRSPHSEEVGPYLPVGTKEPRWLAKFLKRQEAA